MTGHTILDITSILKSLRLLVVSKVNKVLFLRKIEKNGQVYYKYKGQFYPEYLNTGNAGF